MVADPAECSVQFDPVGTAKFTSSCDIAKSFLAKRGVPYPNEAAPPGRSPSSAIGQTVTAQLRREGRRAAELKAPHGRVREAGRGRASPAAGYPAKADMRPINEPMVVLLLGSWCST